MASVFTKIINREIPAHIISESSQCVAFLDVFPIAKGHCLVVPKAEIDYIFGIDDALYAELFLFSKKIAIAIEKAVPCKKVGVAVVGLEVPHAHIHLVPINHVGDINFSNPKLKLDADEMQRIAGDIRKHL